MLAMVAAFLVTLQSQAAMLAYIPNQAGASVSVVNVSSGVVVATVPVGAAPIGVVATPDGQYVYVAGHNSNTVAVIQTSTNNVLAQVSAGTKPMGVAVSPNGLRLYVTNFLTATASGGGSLWVNGTLTVVDTVTRSTLATVTIGANPAGLATSPDGSRVYVANAGAGTLSVVSTASNTVTSTIPVGANPMGVATSPDGQRVYVANSGSASVSVINAATLAVISTVRVGGHATGITVSDDSTRVVVSNTFDNSVSVINTATQTVATTTTVGIGQGPAGIAFVPGSNTALVANSKGATLSSIDSASGTATVLTASTLGWPVSLGKFVTLDTQSISFTGSTPTLTVGGTTNIGATATSGLPVSFSVPAPSPRCSISGTGLATGLSEGICTVYADQPGNATYAPAPRATLSFSVTAPLTTPSAPTNIAVTAGIGSALITFTPPTNTGGGSIVSYIATCTAPGQSNKTATGASSPLTVIGLTSGLVWSCSVAASNGVYTSAASSVQTVTPRVDLTPILMLLLN